MAKRAAPHRGIDTPQADPEGPSKTKLKAESQALQDLGKDLGELSAARLAATEMPEILRDAILLWRRTTAHEGKRRQLQYIGKLMRNVDDAPLREAVAAAKLGSAHDTWRLHEAERWREALISDDDALTRWLAEHPDTDTQHLRSLVRAARRDSTALTPEMRQPKSYRELFQFLRPLINPPPAP
jgi:ribosome-associated protein